MAIHNYLVDPETLSDDALAELAFDMAYLSPPYGPRKIPSEVREVLKELARRVGVSPTN